MFPISTQICFMVGKSGRVWVTAEVKARDPCNPCTCLRFPHPVTPFGPLQLERFNVIRGRRVCRSDDPKSQPYVELENATTGMNSWISTANKSFKIYARIPCKEEYYMPKEKGRVHRFAPCELKDFPPILESYVSPDEHSSPMLL